jgi:Chaperone for flagella basal body P-ring formation
MKHLFIFVCVLTMSLPARGSDGESACARVVLPASIEVQDGEFSLAELLPPDACPALRRLAARMPLGHTPLPGSPRIFNGQEIRILLDKRLPLGAEVSQKNISFQIPERIKVSRAGARASCFDLAGSIAEASLSTRMGSLTGKNLVRDSNCGAAGRIRQDVPIAIAKTVWNPALTSLEITARCLDPKDCVPFLVSARASSLEADALSLAKLRTKSHSYHSTEPPIVRPGQSMTLLWDQDGIQITLHVTCLDRGGLGETVRARLKHGDRILRAKVMNAETLRMQL